MTDYVEHRLREFAAFEARAAGAYGNEAMSDREISERILKEISTPRHEWPGRRHFMQVLPKPEWWDRFFASVYRFDRYDRGEGCWIWTGPWDECGYGMFARSLPSKTGGRTHAARAHRFLLEQQLGPIPANLVVRHRCDNPTCVNLLHLTVGTIRENMVDRDSRHRRIIKLNVHQAREILAFRGCGISAVEVAEAYGVSLTLVKNIWRGTMWQRAHDTAAIAAEIAN